MNIIINGMRRSGIHHLAQLVYGIVAQDSPLSHQLNTIRTHNNINIQHPKVDLNQLAIKNMHNIFICEEFPITTELLEKYHNFTVIINLRETFDLFHSRAYHLKAFSKDKRYIDAQTVYGATNNFIQLYDQIRASQLNGSNGDNIYNKAHIFMYKTTKMYDLAKMLQLCIPENIEIYNTKINANGFGRTKKEEELPEVFYSLFKNAQNEWNLPLIRKNQEVFGINIENKLIKPNEE